MPVPHHTAPTSDGPVKTCCNTAVALVFPHGMQQLLILRADGKGWALVSGHASDEHKTYADAVVAEARQEVGMTVRWLDWIAGGWSDNPCRRNPGPRGNGHEWKVAEVLAWEGEITPDPREVAGYDWVRPARIADLADRTLAASRGLVTAAQWAQEPGLEAIHCRWMVELGIIRLTEDELASIAEFGMVGVPRS